MQYWKPDAPNEFAGDMMPYWDGERFHLFYLLDRDHHQEQNGLGGHQWAHASTRDLLNWEHHPLAVPIGEPGSYDQHGICTGSIFEHDGVYQAFYATRIRQPDGSTAEVLCRAAGSDLVHFQKSPKNPMFGVPAGLDPQNFRDPCVFRHAESGVFHMLVTASVERHGMLAHYTSNDLENWEYQGPFLPPGDVHVPECPELFFWNGWWYLVYSRAQRLEYWISRESLGPWQRARRENIESMNLVVPRTAEFTSGRRIAVGFLQWREDDRDEGDYVYAGNIIFRELIQDADGTLFTKFVSEMMPATGPASEPNDESILVTANSTVSIPDVPIDATIQFRINADSSEYGLILRADDELQAGYWLLFSPREKRVSLQRLADIGKSPRAVVEVEEELESGASITICMRDSIIDVCINERYTMVERCFNHRGTKLGFFSNGGNLQVDGLSIAPIL